MQKLRFKSFFEKPLSILYTLCISGLLCYACIKHFAFISRLEALFLHPDWRFFGTLYQLQVWGFIVYIAGAALIWNLTNKYAKLAVITVSTLFLLTQAVDSFLLQVFNARLVFEQGLELGKETLAFAAPFFISYFHTAASACMVLFWLSWITICVLGYRHTVSYNKTRILYIGIALLLLWHFAAPNFLHQKEQTEQLSDWMYAYIHPSNLPPPIENIPPFELTYQCQDGLNSRKNVLIILQESVSSSLTGFFSEGRGKLTPQLDKLAKKHLPFTHHHTTNFVTAPSLFSILTGMPAIHYYLATSFYRDARFYKDTLPRLFSRQGYHTAFFTSADQTVCFKNLILERAGFDEISDNTDPFYKGHKRFVFDSVADDVLFDRAEQWLQQRKPDDKPYLLFLETTTTHTPFYDPQTGKVDFNKSFLYADKALGNFIKHLFQKKLLDNTIVLITADHRVMSPVTQEELLLFGKTAGTRVPLVFINSPVNQPLTIETAHIDLAPSLAYLTLPQACFHPFQQNMFTREQTRSSCMFSKPLEKGHKVLIECPDQTAAACLLPRGMYFCEGDLPSPERENALSFLSWLRDHSRY